MQHDYRLAVYRTDSKAVAERQEGRVREAAADAEAALEAAKRTGSDKEIAEAEKGVQTAGRALFLALEVKSQTLGGRIPLTYMPKVEDLPEMPDGGPQPGAAAEALVAKLVLPTTAVDIRGKALEYMRNSAVPISIQEAVRTVTERGDGGLPDSRGSGNPDRAGTIEFSRRGQERTAGQIRADALEYMRNSAVPCSIFEAVRAVTC